MLAGMKQPYGAATLRITGILPCAFAQRAVNAGQREIVHAGITTRHLRHNMINMKCGRLAYLRKSAVFTAVLCPAGDTSAQADRNSHAFKPSML